MKAGGKSTTPGSPKKPDACGMISGRTRRSFWKSLKSSGRGERMEHALRHPYLRVSGPGGVTYGGSQRRGRAAHMRRWGCGVIAAADLMLYLSLHRPGCRGTLFAGAPPAEEIDLDWYNDRADRLRRRWLPVIPWHGINGLALAFGVSVCLRRQGIPLHARWGVRPGRLWARIDRLLDADIPVVLSIGGGFPCFWKKDRLALYPAPEKCAPAARTRSAQSRIHCPSPHP